MELLIKAGERKELREYPVTMILSGTLESNLPCPPDVKRSQ
jgi:hypothetical protein